MRTFTFLFTAASFVACSEKENDTDLQDTEKSLANRQQELFKQLDGFSVWSREEIVANEKLYLSGGDGGGTACNASSVESVVNYEAFGVRRWPERMQRPRCRRRPKARLS